MRLIAVFFIMLLPLLAWSVEPPLKPVVVGKMIDSADYKRGASFNHAQNPRISMDLDILRKQKNYVNKQPIVIEMGDNTSLVFVPQRLTAGKKEGDFSWVGKSEDGKAKAIFSIRNGVMIGTVTYNNVKYKIYPENGHFQVIEVDSSRIIKFGDDMRFEPERIIMPAPTPPEGELIEEYTPQQNEESYSEPTSMEDTVSQASQASSSDSVVNVLLYYTSALKAEYGALTEAMILDNFNLAHDAYVDSESEVNLQLIDIRQVQNGSPLDGTDASDSSSTNPLSDLLAELAKNGQVRYERELLGADAVAIFSKKTAASGYCGLGRTPTSTSSTLVGAFSALHLKPPPVNPTGSYSLCSDLSYAHELGHNFGCFHDANHASGTPMYPYAFGYDIPGEFATVMSYDNPEINFFSNPALTYHNTGTGNTSTIGHASSADNARTIRENQLKMADNSEQISEALESPEDNITDYAINGSLNNSADRDGYIMWLEGSTVFDKSYHGFYINLYNETTHEWQASFSSDTTKNLAKGRYRIVAAFSNDESGRYYLSSNTNYSIDIQTEYEAVQLNPAVINYLLD